MYWQEEGKNKAGAGVGKGTQNGAVDLGQGWGFTTMYKEPPFQVRGFSST
jgi:hypothetical protein